LRQLEHSRKVHLPRKFPEHRTRPSAYRPPSDRLRCAAITAHPLRPFQLHLPPPPIPVAKGAGVSMPDGPAVIVSAENALKLSALEHFKMTTSPPVNTVKPLAERVVVNMTILANALRIIETQGEKNATDIANLTAEVRLRPLTPPQTQETIHEPAGLTWKTYGVEPNGSVSPSEEPQSRSGSIAGDSEKELGAVEDLEFRFESSRDDLNGRILALERTLTQLPGDITAPQLQEAMVQRLRGITKDLGSLNDELLAQGQEAHKANADILKRMDALEDANASLRAQSASQRAGLDALQVRLSQLEVSVAPPVVYSRAPSAVPVISRTQSPSDRGPPLSYPPKMARGRDRSPEDIQQAKRARTDGRAFISFGPLAESAETPIKLFELHLRTAITHFRLAAPYQVNQDPAYPHHLRISVVSNAVAGDLIAAWNRQTVAGYSKIKMVEMRDSTGRESALIPGAGARADSSSSISHSRSAGPSSSYSGSRNSSQHGFSQSGRY
ncbi:hypothetical protein C8R46DRAFT_1272047, partial [Mycena filopes]